MEIIETEDHLLENIFWGNPLDKNELKATLKKIMRNIGKVKLIPLEKRKFDF